MIDNIEFRDKSIVATTNIDSILDFINNIEDSEARSIILSNIEELKNNCFFFFPFRHGKYIACILKSEGINNGILQLFVCTKSEDIIKLFEDIPLTTNEEINKQIINELKKL